MSVSTKKLRDMGIDYPAVLNSRGLDLVMFWVVMSEDMRVNDPLFKDYELIGSFSPEQFNLAVKWRQGKVFRLRGEAVSEA